MPVILVATDYSKVADNALQYACELALTQNADIAIVHTYVVPIALGDLSITMPVNDFRLEAEAGMKRTLAWTREMYPQINFTSTILYGDIVDGINQFTEQYETPMMVVTGNSYTPEKPAWMDSTLLEAFRELQYPVLAIPAETAYAQVRKIGFVYDNKPEGSKTALLQLTAIAAQIGAELHVYHAYTDADKDATINEEATTLLAPANPLYHYSQVTDINDDILTFIGKYQLDWLILMPRKHSFFESLFHKSHTRALVNNAFIPVLALHETDD